jgi:hypothetical protein
MTVYLLSTFFAGAEEQSENLIFSFGIAVSGSPTGGFRSRFAGPFLFLRVWLGRVRLGCKLGGLRRNALQWSIRAWWRWIISTAVNSP